MKKYLVLFFLLSACVENLPYNLGSNFYLDYNENSYFTIYDSDGKKGSRSEVIEGEIIKINNDSKFLIACTKPVRKIRQVVDPNQVLTYNEIITKVTKSPIREYWILSKKMKSNSMINKRGEYYLSNVFGPFNKEEYLKKCRELGISSNLKLIPVMQFLDKE